MNAPPVAVRVRATVCLTESHSTTSHRQHGPFYHSSVTREGRRVPMAPMALASGHST